MHTGRSNRVRKGMRLITALAQMVFVVALNAQGTWSWDAGVCPSNTNWYGYCSAGTCPGDITRGYWVNNWRVYACDRGSLAYPGPGSEVYLNWTATDFTVFLSAGVDVKSIFANNRCTFIWQSGSLTLRDPANNNAPGTFTNQGLVQVVGSYSRGLLGLLVNNGTLVQQAGNTFFRRRHFAEHGHIRSARWRALSQLRYQPHPEQ